MRFGVLGPLQVVDADGEVTIGSASQRRLLTALLVDRGAVVSTDRLIAALWGDDPPPTALDSLRTYVYRLRARLDHEGALIATRPPGYVLQVEADQVDAGRFEHLVSRARTARDDPADRCADLDEALSLWRGPAFAEFADTEVARAEALRLEELRRVAIEERFDARLSVGEHAGLVAEIEAFVAAHPLRELARGQLMLALYRTDRQAEALATFRELRQLLDIELGLAVSPSLRALERDILQRAPHLEAEIPHGGAGSAVATADVRQPPAVPAPVGRALPTEPRGLLGRDVAIDEVAALLRPGRLVTVTGVGGIGKTRVALRLAWVAAGHGEDAWWVDLSAIADPGDVAPAVATALEVRASDGGSVTDAVVGRLRDRDGLLVLDNGEHVIDGLIPLVRALLDGRAATSLLVTSRTPLGLDDEVLYRLEPLEVGDGHRDGPAVELFLARSRAVRSDLVVTAEERVRIRDICRRLDGLPLALELAASRLRSLNPLDLADRLDDRLDLIADPRREVPRHQALRTVLDLSYDLLSRAERRLFARLSVFAGPFTLEAAEQVASGEGIGRGEVVDLLARLVDHNLVVLLPDGGVARYTMLETLRLYGSERLADAGEEMAVRRRHAAYHVDIATSADAQVRSREEGLGVARLDRVFDDLRSAHHWSVAHGEMDLAMVLVSATFRYALWRLRAEALAWAEVVAELPSAAGHPLLPVVAGVAGWATGLRGDLDAADAWAQRGIDAVDDHDPRALVPLEVRMHTALWQGHLDVCLHAAERAAALTDDPYELVAHYVPGLALTYAGRAEEALQRLEPVQVAADRHGNPTMRALVRYAQGEALAAIDPARALRPLEAAAELAAQVDSRMVLGVVDVALVSLEVRHGDGRGALSTFVEVIDRLHRGGDGTHLWTGLRGLVEVLARLGADEEAAVVLAAVREADGAPPAYGEDAERLVALEDELRRRLGDEVLRSGLARGRAMTANEAIAFARELSVRHRDAGVE